MHVFEEGGSTLPKNKYPEETREKILEESLKLFLEKGYEKTTVLDIIAKLGGMTRGAFYHHFKSKEAVLEALFEQLDGEFNIFHQARDAKVANGLERLRLALKLALNSNISSDKNISLIRMAMALLEKPYFFAKRHEENLALAKEFEVFVAEGMEDGSIGKGNPKLLAELLVIFLNQWLLPNLYPCTPEETEEKAEMIIQILETLGCPLIDEEMGEIFVQVLDTFDW